MKRKMFLAEIFGMVLVFTIMSVGCNIEPELNTDPKQIKITGLPDKNGKASLSVLASNTKDSIVAVGEGTISGASVTIPLVTDGNGTPWIGNGPII